MNVEGESRVIPVALLREPTRPIRETMDEEGLLALAESIKTVGLLSPLHVVAGPDGHYEVRAGHRRLKALRLLDAPDARCIVLDGQAAHDDAVKVHENLFREELNPAEEATYYAQLYEELKDTEAIARTVRRPRDYVEGRLNLLRGHRCVLEALAAKRISLGVALELQRITSEEHARFYLSYAERGGCTVALARQWRMEANARAEHEQHTRAQLDPATSTTPAAAPAPAPAPSIFGLALPHELSSSQEVRDCLFCREPSEEWRMIRKFVCAPCGERLFAPGATLDPNRPRGHTP